ncbi:MAG: KH domain-containing protein [Dehalococcoidia bacterium]|nr:MAG: KH domain-containing protein [bacterium]MCE7928067.1 KH domain-containing protein [Chloroflexi bacterium CFX7]MCK6564591.1 KH domain-containing protein [Dehalococcoidia bacterium]MCL4229974.1 KH domain-containing protein [Dehalococcoidia bacterium]NUQ56487.1 KH domain-containing protein [Dehalococcoidia bacterium]
MAGVVEYVAKGLVDDPESVSVSERDEGGRVVVRLDVAEDDWGKVIGKGGRIAAAMRSLLKVAAVQEDVRASLEIGD